MKNSLNAISLFSSSGIGDLGLHANGIKTVVSCELLKERVALYQSNNPETKCFCGDIWKLQDDIVNYYFNNFEENPFILLATPPCQGMSSNGMGKMLNGYRKGLRPEYDERNRLIIPTLNIIKRLKPEWIIFENVSNMSNTFIYDDTNKLVNIVDYIYQILGDEYVGGPKIIDCADYGIPQHRVRLLAVFSRSENGRKFFKSTSCFLPETTHAKKRDARHEKWISLREAIGDLPPLRAEKGMNIDKNNPLHKVPLLDEKKLWWLDNTEEGDSAFNNQCVNPSCLYKGNKIHGASYNEAGINKSSQDTPLFCEKCGALLPRPCVEDKITGELRIMKGYISAYRRMLWDEPASTLTQNFQFACSDNKVHPSQTRVLSLYEALIIQSIASYPYSFVVKGKLVKDSLIRDTIGESVPPRIIDLICKNILNIENIH